MIGRWPLMSADEARSLAGTLLRDCRAGKMPGKPTAEKLPTLRQVLPKYADAKGIKASSSARYESILKVHFGAWQDCSLDQLSSAAFSKHCHDFARNRGAAIVEVGRGLIGAIFRYVNAIHGLQLASPFDKLAAAGLMPNRAEPRERRLQVGQLVAWAVATHRLPERQKDLLMLLALTGLRRNEGGMLRKSQVDIVGGVLRIPETKTGQPHSLPITPLMSEILTRRCVGLMDDQRLFDGVSLDHLAEMAMRTGAPSFMLHDLRKLLATTGEQLGLSDAVLRRILNHKAKRSDTLHRHYVRLSVIDILVPLMAIQSKLMDQLAGTTKRN